MKAANDSLRVNGIGRDAEDPRTLVIYFNERPSDDDLRRIHDLIRDGAQPMNTDRALRRTTEEQIRAIAHRTCTEYRHTERVRYGFAETHLWEFASRLLAEAQPSNTDSASGSPSSYRARPSDPDLNPVSVKDLSASASPATKEQQ